MTTEEIKMIVDAVDTVSGDAKDVLITYFMVDRIPDFIINLLWLFIVFIIVTRGMRVLFTLSECVNYIKRKRDEYGIGSNGMLMPSEITHTIGRIERDLEVRS